MIVGGRLADVIGGKWVYGCGLLLSSILSVFTPLLLTRFDSAAWAAFGLRIAQGCLHGVTFPALHALTVRWTTAGGRGLFVAKVGFTLLSISRGIKLSLGETGFDRVVPEIRSNLNYSNQLS